MTTTRGGSASAASTGELYYQMDQKEKGRGRVRSGLARRPSIRGRDLAIIDSVVDAVVISTVGNFVVIPVSIFPVPFARWTPSSDFSICSEPAFAT